MTRRLGWASAQRRKLLVSLAIVAAAASIAGLGTFATFTSSTSASQSVSSGTVTIALGATGAATNRLTVGASNIAPGDTIQRSVDLINSGSIDLSGITLTTKRLDSSKFTEETGVTALFDIAISGWSVNPDPEEVLGTHLCSRRPTASGQGGGTESFYCDPTYESLYLQQQKELDRGKRAEIIKKMEERLYSDAPVIALYYPNDLEGYRKDRIASITPIPEDKGLLYGGSGYWPFYTLEAVSKDGETAESGGLGGGVIAGIAAAVVVVLIGGFFVLRRRQGAADERE